MVLSNATPQNAPTLLEAVELYDALEETVDLKALGDLSERVIKENLEHMKSLQS